MLPRPFGRRFLPEKEQRDHRASAAMRITDGIPALTISLTKLSSANGSASARACGLRWRPYARQSFNTIQRTLIEAVLFTGLILLVFLHTWRSTLIVLVSVPASLFTMFGLMSVLGMDLNLFSMLAVTLSVGILVDDSIVVLENIYRHLGLGAQHLADF
jgi:predicted exporter